jgi:foldase protein PrsA
MADTKNKYVPLIWGLLAGFILGGLASAIIFNMTKDKTVAMVNGTPIKRSELYHVLKNQNGAGALQRLIDNLIVEKMAHKFGIKVSDRELETELANKINLEYHSKEAFVQSLATLNMSISQAKEELRLAMLFDRIATRDIQVSEEEIRQYYQKNPGQFIKPEMRRVRETVIKTRAEAESIRKELLNGVDFAGLVRDKSIGLDRDKGGDRGFVVKGALNQVSPDVEKIVFSLGRGEISPVIQAPDGFHIVRIEAIIPSFQMKYEEYKPAIALKVKLEKCRPFQDILTEMRQESTIQVFENFKPGEQ